MRALPISLLFIPLTILPSVVAILTARHWPVTALLMLGFQVFWSIVAINLGFLGIAVEASVGRVAKAWLIAPIAWFGIYSAFAASERFAIVELRKEIAAANAGISVPFDANERSLVLSSKAAALLVDHFDLRVAYSPKPSDGFSHTSVRILSRDACDHVRAAKGFLSVRVLADSFHYRDPRTGRWAFERAFCNVRRPETPPLPLLVVNTDEQDERAGTLKIRSSISSITTGDGSTAKLRGGTAWPLWWIPVPAFGCLPGVACGLEFWRSGPKSLHSGGPDDMGDEAALAAALGLKPVALGERDLAEMGRAAAELDVFLRDRVETAIQLLDRTITDISIEADAHAFQSLLGRTDLFLPRLEGMMQAIERSVRGQLASANARQLFGLLKQLPREALAPYADRLDALWVRDERYEYDPGREINARFPERCKTVALRQLDDRQIRRHLAEHRNDPISDEAILAAYRDPQCHPSNWRGRSILGTNRGIPIELRSMNGHLVVAYTPDPLAMIDGREKPIDDQTCATIGGVEMVFGPKTLCVPPPVAPLMQVEADRIARAAAAN